MIQQGIIEGKVDPSSDNVSLIASTQREDYHLSPADGIYETLFEVGNEVKKGEPLGQVHFPERHDRPPEVVIFRLQAF